MTPATSLIMVSGIEVAAQLSLEDSAKIHHVAVDPAIPLLAQLNAGLDQALRHKADLLWCHPGCKLTQAAVQELRAALAHDDQAGFAVPTVCQAEAPRPGSLLDQADWRKKLLPRFEFIPTVTTAAVMISYRVIDRYRQLDAGLADLPAALNDLVQKAGGLGMRVVLTNHMQVDVDPVHGEAATAAAEPAMAQALRERHPHLDGLLATSARSATARIRQTMSQIDRADSVVVDCLGYPPLLNGTSIYARSFLVGLNEINAPLRRKITVLIDPAVHQLLALDELKNLEFCHSPQLLRPHFTLIRIGQPFSMGVLDRALTHSICAVNVFFDTISQDVSGLHGEALEILWSQMSLAYADLIFISEASRRAFTARYPARQSRLHVVYPSLALPDYGPGRTHLPDHPHDGPVLVVGNSFAHKDVDHTLSLLLADESLASHRFQVLTNSRPQIHSRVEVFTSGTLAHDDVVALYAGCSVLVYPSYYEGFGLPVMEALHHGKPVFARDLPPLRELRQLLGAVGANIHLFSDTAGLMRLMNDIPQWIDGPNPSGAVDWAAVAANVLGLSDQGAIAALPQQRFDMLTSQHAREHQDRVAQGRLQAAEQRAQAAEIHARQLELQRDELFLGHRDLSAQRDQLAIQLQLLADSARDLAVAHTQVLESRSWRVTAPLRWFSTQVSRLRSSLRRS